MQINHRRVDIFTLGLKFHDPSARLFKSYAELLNLTVIMVVQVKHFFNFCKAETKALAPKNKNETPTISVAEHAARAGSRWLQKVL
jgi:hypothetical protein